MTPYRLGILGPPSLRGPSDADLWPRSRKLACMVAFLALEPAGRATRERLCGVLWSDRGEEQARGSLRQALSELRRAWADAAPGLLLADHGSVALALGDCTVDALDAERLAASGEAHDLVRLAGLWRGELLAGVSAPDPGFDEWLLIERAHWARQLGRAIELGLERAGRDGDEAAVDALAGCLLRHNPASEPATKALMMLYLRRGDAAGALRHFTRHRDALARDLGVLPSPEVEELHARARRLAAAPAAPPPTRAAAPVARVVRRLPCVAVQFRPAIGPPGVAGAVRWLVQEEFMLCLTRARQIAVLTCPDEGAVPPEADYALITTVSCDEAAARVVVRLCRRPDGQVLFCDRFELPPSEGHAAMVQKLGAVAFRVGYLAEADVAAHAAATPEIDPYALWLSADRLGQSFQPDDLQAAVRLFEAAARADPGFAKPIIGLAGVELSLPMIHPTDVAHVGQIEKGFQLARKAVSLDPWDARGHTALAWAHLRRRTPASARESFTRALALNPTDPDVLMACAEGLSYFGETDASLSAGRSALALHAAPPDYYHQYISVAYSNAGLHEQALAHNEAVVATYPEQMAWRALYLSRLGRPAEARSALAHLMNEMERKWCGPAALDRPGLLRWLGQTLLIPAEPDRVAFVAEIERLLEG